MLQIYNSLSNRKEAFTPIEENHVRMYACGMTVYDYCHLGHARVMIVFDAVARYLRSVGYKVTYIRNITDIDDKIIQRANENGEPFMALTQRFIAAMHEDEQALGNQPPSLEPLATSHMDSILAMIEKLIEKDFAYQASNGDVYYSVARFEGYGKLSGRNLDELKAGERIAIDNAKRDPLDFVLWKSAKPDEPSWDSPWGKGRPGWHIECSAMSTQHLGNHFDIHGGGHDLQFPHHENEIAQSEACTGEDFANFWMHIGFIRVNDEKMSKSLGNFFTIREVLNHYRGEEIRYYMLASHYRSPLNYSTEQLDSARNALDRLYNTLRGLPEPTAEIPPQGTEYEQRFHAAMHDDFNTPEAMAALFDLARSINRLKNDGQTRQAIELALLLKQLAGVLGLLGSDAEAWFKAGKDQANTLGDAEIEDLIKQRSMAKEQRDWAEADRIRDLLNEEHGILIEDGAAGTSWRRS